MTDMATNRGLLFMGDDLSRPRMAVESEKIKRYFPQFRFKAKKSRGTVTSVEGDLETNDGNSYYVKIKIPDDYPYTMPSVSLPETNIDSDCPHRYGNKKLCVMKYDQWTSNYSLAFMIAKAAIWINKYDVWQRTGHWPGRQQEH